MIYLVWNQSDVIISQINELEIQLYNSSMVQIFKRTDCLKSKFQRRIEFN